MRIVIHDFAGHAFTLELARELARRDYRVDYVYFKEWPGSTGHLDKRADDPTDFRLVPTSIGRTFSKYSFVKRWFQEWKYGLAVKEYLLQVHPDVVISGNTPLDPQWAIQSAARASNAKFLYWLQDIQSLAMAHYLPEKHRLAGRIAPIWYDYLERKMLRQSTWVVCIADSFTEFVRECGVDPKRVTVIGNWAPKGDIRPMKKDNPWAREHGLSNKKVFLYAGALGLKHSPELLALLASRYLLNPEIAVVVISEGLGANWLRQRKEKYNLTNLVVLPFQPFAKLGEVLGAGDVLISLIERDAAAFSVPSKILSYMAAGRSLLLSVPHDNMAAAIVRDNGAGIVVEPGDDNGFLDAAERLISDEGFRAECAVAARVYAEEWFDITKVADKFLEVVGEGG